MDSYLIVDACARMVFEYKDRGAGRGVEGLYFAAGVDILTALKRGFFGGYYTDRRIDIDHSQAINLSELLGLPIVEHAKEGIVELKRVIFKGTSREVSTIITEGHINMRYRASSA